MESQTSGSISRAAHFASQEKTTFPSRRVVQSARDCLSTIRTDYSKGGAIVAKATIKLPNGTLVVVEGTTEDVKELLEFYGGSDTREGTARHKEPKAEGKAGAGPKESAGSGRPDLAEIIGLIKNCAEAGVIGSKILDRTSLVDRVLLPLYIVHEHLGNKYALTSGEISRITADLGIRVATPHASTTLSGSASKYVIGDSVRKKGKAVRYKLSRPGLQYLKGVLKGSEDAQ